MIVSVIKEYGITDNTDFNYRVEYSDGTKSTVDQMAKDVTTFLAWAAEPELEERHRTGVKVIIYLILLTILVYLSMKKIWSRIDSEI